MCHTLSVVKYNNLFSPLCYDLTDGPEENSSKLLSTVFVEEPQHRLKWTAYLEFSHNHEVGDLTWDKVGNLYNQTATPIVNK